MIYEVSEKLREKIKLNLIIDDTTCWKYGNDHVAHLIFDDNEDDIMNECSNWVKTIRTDQPKSLNYLKVDRIGRFKGIRPIDYGKKVFVFQVEEYEKESWKDWFIELEPEYKLKGIGK
jgi:hypothetical protein